MTVDSSCLFTGVALSYPNDEARLARGAAVFDDLYFRHKRP